MKTSHIMCTSKILTDLWFTKKKKKKKEENIFFCKSCLQCLSSKNVLTGHKGVCLSINGAQSVKLEKGKMLLNKYKFHSKIILILSVF